MVGCDITVGNRAVVCGHQNAGRRETPDNEDAGR
jgi:hypothetical protein